MSLASEMVEQTSSDDTGLRESLMATNSSRSSSFVRVVYVQFLQDFWGEGWGRIAMSFILSLCGGQSCGPIRYT
jgi:hypothetical protein